MGHGRRIVDRILWRAADELDDRRGGGHREAAHTRSLGDFAGPHTGRRVLLGVAGEEESAYHRRPRGKPLIPRAADTDAELDAITGHGRDHTAPWNTVGGIEHGLTGGHGEIQKEVIVTGDEVDGGGGIG